MNNGHDEIASAPWIEPRSAYVHIPFCAHHCGYCDFAISVGQDEQIERYIQALDQEMGRVDIRRPLETLFLGGGTPTYLPFEHLRMLLEALRRRLPIVSDAEFSVEANPDTLHADKIALLAEYGVNRVSLGAQSFHHALLRTLERDHRPEDVAPLFERVRRRIDVVSLDLIFGVPGQTLEQWRSDLGTALALEPDHVSTYGLTYEKGTPLWKERQRGQVRPLDEEAELAMYTQAMDDLQAAGFEHYEISNFARPGRHCKHNEVYWANHAHHGFGMGAARYVNLVRDLNTRDLATYLKRLEAAESPVFQSECLSPLERALETAAIQLRRARGIERRSFAVQTGFGLDELRGSTVRRLTELGLVRDDGASVRLTREGKCVADSVVTELLKEVDC